MRKIHIGPGRDYETLADACDAFDGDVTKESVTFICHGGTKYKNYFRPPPANLKKAIKSALKHWSK